MSRQPLHPLARDYLARLERAGRHLDAERLADLISEIHAHLAETIPPGTSDHDALHALERLGPVGDIVEAEQPTPRPARSDTDQRGLREWAAVFLLPLGGFVLGVGWLLGLSLLWSSRLWTTRDKLIGSFIVPGGLVTACVALLLLNTTTATSCSGRAAAVDPATGAVIRPAAAMHCTTTGPSTATTTLYIILAAVLTAGPIISAIYLARRARRNQTPHAIAA